VGTCCLPVAAAHIPTPTGWTDCSTLVVVPVVAVPFELVLVAVRKDHMKVGLVVVDYTAAAAVAAAADMESIDIVGVPSAAAAAVAVGVPTAAAVAVAVVAVDVATAAAAAAAAAIADVVEVSVATADVVEVVVVEEEAGGDYIVACHLYWKVDGAVDPHSGACCSVSNSHILSLSQERRYDLDLTQPGSDVMKVD